MWAWCALSISLLPFSLFSSLSLKQMCLYAEQVQQLSECRWWFLLLSVEFVVHVVTFTFWLHIILRRFHSLSLWFSFRMFLQTLALFSRHFLATDPVWISCWESNFGFVNVFDSARDRILKSYLKMLPYILHTSIQWVCEKSFSVYRHYSNRNKERNMLGKQRKRQLKTEWRT